MVIFYKSKIYNLCYLFFLKETTEANKHSDKKEQKKAFVDAQKT